MTDNELIKALRRPIKATPKVDLLAPNDSNAENLRNLEAKLDAVAEACSQTLTMMQELMAESAVRS